MLINTLHVRVTFSWMRTAHINQFKCDFLLFNLCKFLHFYIYLSWFNIEILSQKDLFCRKKVKINRRKWLQCERTIRDRPVFGLSLLSAMVVRWFMCVCKTLNYMCVYMCVVASLWYLSGSKSYIVCMHFRYFK